jgi:hypothetical protein
MHRGAFLLRRRRDCCVLTGSSDSSENITMSCRRPLTSSARTMSSRSSDQADRTAHVRAAVMTTSATSLGWEIMTTCEAPSISVTVAPIRL